MGFWKGAGKVAGGTLKVLGKVTVVTAKVAAKGAGVAAQAGWDHRGQIGKAAATTASVAGKVVSVIAKGMYKAGEMAVGSVSKNRDAIAKMGTNATAVAIGITVGTTKATASAIRNASAHVTISKEDAKKLVDRIQQQSCQYRQFTARSSLRRSGAVSKSLYLDTLVVGGNTLASYMKGPVPPDIDQAFQFQYPDLAATQSFGQVVQRLEADELPGFVSGVKGKLFEMRYADNLNDGHLPDGYQASLAPSATQKGWDLSVSGPDGNLLKVNGTYFRFAAIEAVV